MLQGFFRTAVIIGLATAVTLAVLGTSASLLRFPSFEPGPDPSLRAMRICSRRFPSLPRPLLAFQSCFQANGGNGTFIYSYSRPHRPPPVVDDTAHERP